jgi:PAS domain S-box-containing protein
MIRSAAKFLERQFGDFTQIHSEQQLVFVWEGQHHFLKVLPFHDERGIHWLITIILPESDFTEQIATHRQATVAWIGLSVGCAIAFGLLTTHSINRPLRRLTTASQALANGELEREVPVSEILELDVLSQSFNQMAAQLKQSFRNLEQTNVELEHRVQERTSDLSRSEERFRTLVDNMPGIVYRCTYDQEWKMEFIGGAVEDITGYAAADFIRNQVRSWVSMIHPEDREMVECIVRDGLTLKQPYILEYRIRDAENQIHWLYEKGQGIFTEDGSLLWLDGAIFDISDRKQVEADLLERVHLSIFRNYAVDKKGKPN